MSLTFHPNIPKLIHASDVPLKARVRATIYAIEPLNGAVQICPNGCVVEGTVATKRDNRIGLCVHSALLYSQVGTRELCGLVGEFVWIKCSEITEFWAGASMTESALDKMCEENCVGAVAEEDTAKGYTVNFKHPILPDGIVDIQPFKLSTLTVTEELNRMANQVVTEQYDVLIRESPITSMRRIILKKLTGVLL